MSGTPIQNSVDDLYSCFRFLRYNPYCKKAAFKSMLKDPLQDNPAKGAQLLQVCLKACQSCPSLEKELLSSLCCCHHYVGVIIIIIVKIDKQRDSHLEPTTATYTQLSYISTMKCKQMGCAYLMKRKIHSWICFAQLVLTCKPMYCQSLPPLYASGQKGCCGDAASVTAAHQDQHY